ncbi:DUF1493 family protein [Olleya sp.]|jgi:acyl carrier protein|uniref:DUF1493 family protein n=1 Tax=Olleya sp. TaxID=1906788 RepID=UPI0032D9912C
MERNNIFEKVKEFIIKESLVDYIEITPTTSIEKDLGITGDDAVDLLTKFGNEFHVDVSNFEFKKYFQEEGSWVFGWLSNIFGKEDPIRIHLTMDKLEEAVKKGRLE